MKIGLTGGTGFVGRALLERAVEAGHEVIALTRKPQEHQPGVSWVQGDLADSQALERIADECDVMMHVAGVINAPDPAGFEKGNVTGTLNLIEACVAKGTPRFVFVSSLAARTPHLSAYCDSKARAEKLVRASGLDWSIVRPPAIYGPRDTQMLDLFRSAKWGIMPMPKEGRASLIHVDDLVRLLLALLPGGEAVTGKTFESGDGNVKGWSHYELARAVGFAMGRRPKVFGLSRQTLERLARIDVFVRRGNARLTLDRAAYFCHPDWVVSTQASPPASLWQPQIESRTGLKATADWYREQGWL